MDNQNNQAEELIIKYITKRLEEKEVAAAFNKEINNGLAEIDSKVAAGGTKEQAMEDTYRLMLKLLRVLNDAPPSFTKEEKEEIEILKIDTTAIEGIVIKKEFLALLNLMIKEMDSLFKKHKKNKLPKLPVPRYPEKIFSPNTAVSNKFESLIQDIAKIKNPESVESRPVNMGNVNVYVTAVINSAKVSYGRPYSVYDRSVQNAIDTLIVNGVNPMTPDMIFKTMNGNRLEDRASPKAKEEVKASFLKQCLLPVRIERGELKRKWGKEEYEEEITGNLFDVIERKMTSGGHTVTAYYFPRPSLLYLDAQVTGQILTIEREYLDIKKIGTKSRISTLSESMTARRIAIRDYLIHRILVMKENSNGRQSSVIKVDAIYNAACIDSRTPDELTEKEKRAILAFTRTVLKYYRAIKKIKDFKENNKEHSRLIESIQIIF